MTRTQSAVGMISRLTASQTFTRDDFSDTILDSQAYLAAESLKEGRREHHIEIASFEQTRWCD